MKSIYIVAVALALSVVGGGVYFLNAVTEEDSAVGYSDEVMGEFAEEIFNERSPQGMSDTNAEGVATGEGSGTTQVTDTSVCGITPQTTEGPYYVTGTQALVDGNLNYDNFAGTPITISGYVYAGTDNTTPVANAKIEIWHTDDTGEYWPNNNGAATTYSADELSLRGYVMTDADGKYTFTTIDPGEYSGRTRHIHIRVTADGYKGVITQLITTHASDRLTATSDNIAKSLPTCHQIQNDLADDGKATFDFRLATN